MAAVKTKAKTTVSPFTDSLIRLEALLDSIRTQAPKGKPAPAQAKAAPGTTDSGAKAYGDSYGQAQQHLQRIVNDLSSKRVSYLSGLGFRDPADEKKCREDILASALGAYDASAAKYMKNAVVGGDEARKLMRERFLAFDVAIDTQGKTPVTPDV